MPARRRTNASDAPRHAKQPRTGRYRLATIGLLSASVVGSIVGGNLLARSGPEPANASAALAADRATIAQQSTQTASRDLQRAPLKISASATAKPSAAASASTPAQAAPAKPAAPAIPAGCSGYSGIQLLACEQLPAFGFDYGQMQSLVNLWAGESDWNVYASNADSGAYGIPQALPGDKMASAGTDWQSNPVTQIRWGLGYIRDTYGSPDAAWAAWQSRSPHWY